MIIARYNCFLAQQENQAASKDHVQNESLHRVWLVWDIAHKTLWHIEQTHNTLVTAIVLMFPTLPACPEIPLRVI